jgi:nucleoside-diphosphate-sugar epimerase
MKKILIAGGAGYIGTLLTKELYDRNYNVEVVDLLWFGNYLPKGVKVHKKSCLDLCEQDLKDFDIVIFMAGISNDPMANYNPAMNFIENSAAPSYLAFISKKAGIKRFIYASTCSVYGYTANNLMDENDSAYIRSIESSLEITGIYNISYDNYTIGRLADEIKDELNSCGYDIKIIVKNIQDVRNYKVTNSKAKMQLDFTPKLSPRDSVKEILKNIDAKKINFNENKYYNIATFKERF